LRKRKKGKKGKKSQPKKIGKKRTGKYMETDFLLFSMLYLFMLKKSKR
jgi:hypothetical protein